VDRFCPHKGADLSTVRILSFYIRLPCFQVWKAIVELNVLSSYLSMKSDCKIEYITFIFKYEKRLKNRIQYLHI
jgi:hypothetical protein